MRSFRIPATSEEVMDGVTPIQQELDDNTIIRNTMLLNGHIFEDDEIETVLRRHDMLTQKRFTAPSLVGKIRAQRSSLKGGQKCANGDKGEFNLTAKGKAMLRDEVAVASTIEVDDNGKPTTTPVTGSKERVTPAGQIAATASDFTGQMTQLTESYAVGMELVETGTTAMATAKSEMEKLLAK